MAIDFMNLFAPRGTPSALDALLTADQRKLMNRNANLSAAAALLQASGPSRQRVGIGQALGAALQAGQQGYQQARAGSLQDLMLGEKLRAGQDERERDTDFFAMLRDAGQPAAAMPTPAMPAPAMPAPQQGVQVFPFDAPIASQSSQPSMAGQLQQQAIAQAAAPLSSAQSALIAPRPGTAQPRTAGGAPQTMQEFLQQQPPAYLQSLQGMSRSEAMKSIQERMTQSMKFGKPEFFIRDGKLVAKRFNELGDMKEVPGLAPRDAPSSSIAEYQFAVNQGDKRSYAQFDQDRRRSGASKQTVKMGDNKFGTLSQDTMRIPDSNAPGGYRLINLEGGKGDIEAKDAEKKAQIGSQVTRDAAQTVFEDSGRAIAQLDKYGGQVSGFGALTSFIPGSAAKEFEGHIFSIKSNIGIDQLLKIKASGAGLGAIPQSQLEMLASLLGNLDAKQNTTVLRENILRIQEIYQDIVIKEGGDPLRIARSRGFTFPGDQNPRTLRQTLDTKTIEAELKRREAQR